MWGLSQLPLYAERDLSVSDSIADLFLAKQLPKKDQGRTSQRWCLHLQCACREESECSQNLPCKMSKMCFSMPMKFDCSQAMICLNYSRGGVSAEEKIFAPAFLNQVLQARFVYWQLVGVPSGYALLVDVEDVDMDVLALVGNHGHSRPSDIAYMRCNQPVSMNARHQLSTAIHTFWLIHIVEFHDQCKNPLPAPMQAICTTQAMIRPCGNNKQIPTRNLNQSNTVLKGSRGRSLSRSEISASSGADVWPSWCALSSQ